MNIPWNKVTWYTKLGAVIVVAIAVTLGFYFWNEYKEIQSLNNSAPIELPQNTQVYPVKEESVADVTAGWETYRNQEFGYEIAYPSEIVIASPSSSNSSFSFYIPGEDNSANKYYDFMTINVASRPFVGTFDEHIRDRAYIDVILEPSEPFVDQGDINLYIAQKHNFGKNVEGYISHNYAMAGGRCLFHANMAGKEIIISRSNAGLRPEECDNDALFNKMLSTFRFVEEQKADEISLFSLSAGANKIGNVNVEMLGEFIPIDDIDDNDEFVVLKDIDDRITIRKDGKEVESSFAHHLYFDGQIVRGDFSLVGCQFDCSTTYPIQISSLKQNGVTYLALSSTYSANSYNYFENFALYKLSATGLEHFADIEGRGFTIYAVGDNLLVLTSLSSYSHVATFLNSSHKIDSIRNGQVKDTLKTATCYTSISDRPTSLEDDMQFECDSKPRILLFEHEGQLHFKVRNVTRDGVEQNSYFKLSEGGEFLDVTNDF